MKTWPLVVATIILLPAHYLWSIHLLNSGGIA